MKVEAQNILWETAAGLLGFTVAEVSSRLRRHRNRIEGSMGGGQVSVSYADFLSQIVVSVTVEPEEAEIASEYLVPIQMVVPGGVEEASDVVEATSRAVPQGLAAVRTVRSAPAVSRSVDWYVTSEFRIAGAGDSPPLLAVLQELAFLVPGDGLFVGDTSHPEIFMQAARTDSGYEVHYRDGDAASHFSTETEDIDSAISLFSLLNVRRSSVGDGSQLDAG